jgi:hypothetical protein
MVVCPYCGKESNQPGAAYCLYCGSSLRQATPTGVTATGGGFGQSSGSSSFATSERFEKALARVEQLGNVVIVLAVITLVLVLV